MEESGDEEDKSFVAATNRTSSIIKKREKLKSVRILLVEDDELTRMVMAAQLTFLGIQVEVACDGEQALQYMESKGSQIVDAILTDEQMPRMTGTELTQRLSKTQWRDLPVFLMSSDITRELRDRCGSLRIRDTFTKPVKNSTLLSIADRLPRREAHREHLPSSDDSASRSFSFGTPSHLLAMKRAVSLDESQRRSKKIKLVAATPPLSILTSIPEDNAARISDEDKSQETVLPLKFQKSFSMLPSTGLPHVYDVRCSSLPPSILSREFLKSPKLICPQLQIRPLDITAGLFPRAQTLPKQVPNLMRSSPSSDTRDSEAAELGPQVAASLAQLHHSKASSAFQTLDISGSQPGASIAQADQQRQGSSGSIQPAVFLPPAGILRDHQQRFSDAYQAALKQHKQTEACTANRKAAILRFRAKRKQRSFEKKVRYASRKRLAEQRPRIKGQFVKAADLQAHQAAQS